mmetsp:Transcript_106336/g.184845  ORF Transcript_106336/g.184845 Transcript_106336/m.184845 type:complete len:367 (+) Transcript_106336:61-1161(+)
MAAAAHTLPDHDYEAAFVSAPVRHEVASEKVTAGASLLVEDASAPRKWWEEPEVKAKFAEWGVISVIPPVDTDVRESASTGLLKYGPVTLCVTSKEREAEVSKQMTLYNRSKGAHQAFEVAVRPGHVAAATEEEYDAGFVSAPVRHEVAGEKAVTVSSLLVEDSSLPIKWWEAPEIKAKFTEWGVLSVIPPAEDNVRESASTGLLKYGPVVLRVASKEKEAEVTKQMALYNRSQGMYQAFEVVVAQAHVAESEEDYNAAFASAPVRHEVASDEHPSYSRLVEDSSAPEKWWEAPEVKAKFAEWGVHSVIPPADDDLRDSVSTGLLKYGPVTLHVKSKDLEEEVSKQMTLLNRSNGVHQAFSVVISG